MMSEGLRKYINRALKMHTLLIVFFIGTTIALLIKGNYLISVASSIGVPATVYIRHSLKKILEECE